MTTIALLFLLFVPAMIPALYASSAITKDGAPGTGTAPDYVFAFAVAMVGFFSTFAVVYAWDLVRPMEANRRERWYIYLSMIAKTSLHLFLGLTVIRQSNFVGVDEPSTEEDSMDTLAYGLGGALGLVVGLGIISRYFDVIFGYNTRKAQDEKTDEKLRSLLQDEMNLPKDAPPPYQPGRTEVA